MLELVSAFFVLTTVNFAEHRNHTTNTNRSINNLAQKSVILDYLKNNNFLNEIFSGLVVAVGSVILIVLTLYVFFLFSTIPIIGDSVSKIVEVVGNKSGN